MPEDNEKKQIQGKIRGKSRRAPSQKDTRAREKQLINLAMDVAEEQMLNGTATSQVITHFLKLGTEAEQLHREKIRNENALLRAKVEQIEAQTRIEELYLEATKAMKKYTGEEIQFYDDEEFYDD